MPKPHKRKWFALWELIAAVFICALMTAVLLSSAGSKWMADWRSRSCAPTEADIALPPEDCLSVAIAVEGEWVRGGMDTEGFTFRKRDDGTFDASFRTGGCVDRWELDRVATQTGATLLLDYPVVAYGRSGYYDRVHLIRYDGFDFLLPGNRVSDFNEVVSMSEDAARVSHLAMMRPGEKQRAYEVMPKDADADVESFDKSP